MAPEVLEDFLLRTLQPLSAADPELLSNYVAALLKNNKSLPDLRKLCLDQLWDFLGDSTQDFVDQLFEAIDVGRVELPASHVDPHPQSEPPSTDPTPTADDAGYADDRWPVNEEGGLYAGAEEGTLASGRVEDAQAEAEQELGGGEAAPQPVVVKVSSALARLAGRYEEHDDDDESEDEEEGGRGHRRRGRNERSQSPSEKVHERMGRELEGSGARGGGREGWRGRGGQRSGGRMLGPLQGGARGQFAGRGDKRFGGRGMPEGPRWGGPPGPRFDGGRGQAGPEPGFVGGPFEPRREFPPFAEPPFPPGPRPLGRGMPPPSGPDFGPLPMERRGPPFFGGPDRWEPFPPRLPPPDAEYEMRMRLMHGMERRPEAELRQQPCPEFFGDRGYCLRGRLCPYDHGQDVEVVRDEHALRQLSLARRERNGGPEGGRPVAPIDKDDDDLPQHEFDVVPPMRRVEARGPRVAGEEEGYDPDMPLWDDRGAGVVRDDPGLAGGRSDAITLLAPDVGPSGRPGPPKFAPGGYINPQRQGHRGPRSARLDGRLGPGADELRNEGWENGRGHGGRRGGQSGRGRGRGNDGQGEQALAEKTLFVTGVPAEQNNVSSLLQHFKKFGHVVIRVFGGDKAHVLFDTHEEAEKALQSPDAVMGNRFIRLYWAKQDLDLSKMGGKYGTMPGAGGAEEDAKGAIVDGETTPKASVNGISKGHAYIRPGAEKPAPPALTDAQKKAAEKAALALKIKQLQATVLEAKIAEQRRALAELEKKTGKSSAAGSELKRAMSSGASEGDSLPPGKKARPGGATAWAAPAAGGFKSHFRLDNRSTVLHVVGELPAAGSKEALRMHFWRFGEVVTVQVPEAGSSDAGAGIAAKVVFRQRHDAEAALVEGKEIEGQPLKLVWGPPYKAAAPVLSPKQRRASGPSGVSRGLGSVTSDNGDAGDGSTEDSHLDVRNSEPERISQGPDTEMDEQNEDEP